MKNKKNEKLHIHLNQTTHSVTQYKKIGTNAVSLFNIHTQQHDSTHFKNTNQRFPENLTGESNAIYVFVRSKLVSRLEE